MQLEVIYNEEKDGIELHFSKEPSLKEALHLKQSGFTQSHNQSLKWWAKRRPAFALFAEKLKGALLKGEPVESVLIMPSYDAAEENIDHNNFSYVTLTIDSREGLDKDSYVVFEPWKTIADAVVNRYGQERYGDAFRMADVAPRRFKTKARLLFKQGRVITGESIQRPKKEEHPSKIGLSSIEMHPRVSGSHYTFDNWGEANSLIRTLIEKGSSDTVYYTVVFKDGFHFRGSIYIPIKQYRIGKVEDYLSESLYRGYMIFSRGKVRPGMIEQKDIDQAKRFYQTYDLGVSDERARELDQLLFNEHGVYTEELAGKRMEKVEIPFPKAHKFSASIRLVKDHDELYRFGISVETRYQGQAAGSSYAPHKDGAFFKTREEALKAAFEKIASSQYIHDKARQAVITFALEQGIELETPETGEQETKEDNPEIPFTHELIESEQKIAPLYHGTCQEFERFDNSLLGSNTEDIPSFLGFHFTQDKELATKIFANTVSDNDAFCRVIQASIGVKKTLKATESDLVKGILGWGLERGLVQKKKAEVVKGLLELPYGSEDKNNRGLRQVLQSSPWVVGDKSLIDYKGIVGAFIKKVLRPLGIDSIWYLNELEWEADKRYDWIVLDADQIEIQNIRYKAELDTLTAIIEDHKEGKHIALTQRLVGLGVTGLFTLKQAIETPYRVIDLQSRWYDAYGFYQEHFEQPGKEQIESWKTIQDAIKGDKGQTAQAQCRELKEKISEQESRIAFVKMLIENESVELHTEMVEYAKTRAGELGYAFDHQHSETDFSVEISEGLFNGRMIEGYAQTPIPEVIDELIREFFGDDDPGDTKEPPPEDPQPDKADTPKSDRKLKAFAGFLSRHDTIDGYTGDGKVKKELARLGKAAFKELALYLELDDFMVSFNPGGEAVSGDLTLMGMFGKEKGIYVSFSQNSTLGVLYRTINGMKDFSGGANHYFDVEELATPEKIKERVLSLVKPSQEDAATEIPAAQKDTLEGKYDYLDRVVAHMHGLYDQGERPTKKQIEELAPELGAPNLGMMWEAVELSWLLWYKILYRQRLPFEYRLMEMVRFWDALQPTYAYSDSSKELYKQYSTPCPIGAMVAQYTGMDRAQSIFEPSAGNGLLLVGADERRVHTNEVDKTRLASLGFQGFSKITDYNATEPFPQEMTHAYDVVVTNPPFAQWEDDKFDKELVIRRYFHNQIGLAAHMRLEHLMAGLALHCMKDSGRAAIIIMGHVYFGPDGLVAKYRPFFNWLYRHYKVDDVINLNSFKLYNKQGAIEKTMLILVGGRKASPGGVAPTQKEAPYLYDMVNSFSELWERIQSQMSYTVHTVVNQLQIELA